MHVIAGSCSFDRDELILTITLDDHGWSHETPPYVADRSFQGVASALLTSIRVRSIDCRPFSDKLHFQDARRTAQRRIKLSQPQQPVTLQFVAVPELAQIPRQFQLALKGDGVRNRELRLTSGGNVLAVGRAAMAPYDAEMRPVIRVRSIKDRCDVEVDYPARLLTTILGSRWAGAQLSETDLQQLRTRASAWYRENMVIDKAAGGHGAETSAVDPKGMVTLRLLGGAFLPSGEDACVSLDAVRLSYRVPLRAGDGDQDWWFGWRGFGPAVLQVPVWQERQNQKELIGTLRPGYAVLRSKIDGRLTIESDEFLPDFGTITTP